MIQTNLLTMLKYKVGNYDGHYVYVVREGDTVFYVGRSLDPLARLREHLHGSRGHGPSHLGYFIRKNAEAADTWQVELLTLDDCKPYVDQYGTFIDGEEYWQMGYTRNGRRDKYWQEEVIASAESALIRHYRPCLNIAGNPNPSPLPAKYRNPYADRLAGMLGLQEEE